MDIVTTVPSHRGLIKRAARRRLPVICRKPLAATMADASAMVDACPAAGVPLTVHESQRWQSQIRQVRAFLDSGEIGTPFWERVSFRSGATTSFRASPTWRRASGSSWRASASTGSAPPASGSARCPSLAARSNRVSPAVEGEGGATCVVDMSYAAKRAPDPFPKTTVEVDGSQRSIRLSRGCRLAVTSPAGTREVDASPPMLPWAGKPWHGVQDSVRAIQQHRADCLRAGREPDTSGRDNLRSAALVEAAYAGAAGAGAVDPARH